MDNVNLVQHYDGAVVPSHVNKTERHVRVLLYHYTNRTVRACALPCTQLGAMAATLMLLQGCCVEVLLVQPAGVHHSSNADKIRASR